MMRVHQAERRYIAELVEQYRWVIEGTNDDKQTLKQLKALNQLGVTYETMSLV